jgi:hypothetical protein
MRHARRALYALALILLPALFHGPLFPWSPLKPGYETLRLERSIIVYPAGTVLHPAYRDVDRYIAQAEQFHALAMPQRVTVVACRDWSDLRWFMPQIRGREVGAVTLQTGTVIYVTPKLAEKGLDTGEFLRHELSHAILHQNQSLIDAWRLGKEQWFCEGLAVLFARQRAYITAGEFTQRARRQDLQPLFDGSPQSDMRLAYQAWRYLLDFLIQTGGRERFLQLERGCMADPAACRGIFERVYGRSLARAVAEFQSAVLAGRMIPAE